jgi:hypothetical protein
LCEMRVGMPLALDLTPNSQHLLLHWTCAGAQAALHRSPWIPAVCPTSNRLAGPS